MNKDKLRKNLYRLAAICFIIALIVFAINYFVFHYVTDDGITLVKQAEAGKPFVTNLIGMLGADMAFASILSALCAKILCGKK